MPASSGAGKRRLEFTAAPSSPTGLSPAAKTRVVDRSVTRALRRDVFDASPSPGRVSKTSGRAQRMLASVVTGNLPRQPRVVLSGGIRLLESARKQPVARPVGAQ